MTGPSTTQNTVLNSGQGNRLRILVVIAHPHDFTHSAGTCGVHTARGDSVTAVCVRRSRYA